MEDNTRPNSMGFYEVLTKSLSLGPTLSGKVALETPFGLALENYLGPCEFI